MNFEYLEALVRGSTDALIEARDRPVLGISVGWKGSGPITCAGREDFRLIAYVERLTTDSEREATSFCEYLAQRADKPLQRHSIKVVEVGGPIRPLAFTGSDHGDIPSLNAKKWFAGLRPGISICNPTLDSPTPTQPFRLCAGTAGFFVEDSATRKYLVSCNHVIARSRTTASPEAREPEPIVQPASRDLSGHDLATIANLSDLAKNFGVARLSAYVPLKPDDPSASLPPVNFVDAAMAEVDAPDRELKLNRLPYGGLILGQAAPYTFDQNGRILGSAHVYKVGRTTRYTEGDVTALAGSWPDIEFDGWTATFVDVLVVSPTADNGSMSFAGGGDSGSALITERHELAGLIFVGGPNLTLANPIAAVITHLERESGQKLTVVK